MEMGLHEYLMQFLDKIGTLAEGIDKELLFPPDDEAPARALR
jgi:hypothetical protein